MASRARTRAWLGAVVAVIAAAGVALVSLPAEDAGPPGQSGQGRPMGAVPPAAPAAGDVVRGDAVSALLARRAAAVRDRDEAAFLATVDPQAEPWFREAQQDLFDNLDGVPLAHWSYAVDAADVLDLTGLPDADPTAAELWAPGVELHYALRGVDSVPTARDMGYLFARRGDDWYLHSDTALAELGRRTWRGPWDFAPCQVVATETGLVLAHPGSQPMVDRLVRELDPAVRSVTGVWGGDWSGKVALILPDSPAEMRALVGPDFPVESVVAVATADRVDTAANLAVGQRVVLSPVGARALSVASLKVVLRHEITHVAARGRTVDGSPMWLLEGFADYVGYRDSGLTLAQGAPDLAAQVRASGPPPGLPDDRAFRARDKELDLAYQQAWSIARFIAERFGEGELVELYRSVAGAGPVSAAETDALLLGAIGLDRPALLHRWREHLAEVLG
ncbi:basic secretory protein-like protein [Actinokineospora sp. NPDC004072]